MSDGYRPAPAKRLRARNDSGPRRASSVRHVVIHSTEGGTAASVAQFFATTAKASTHLVIDNAGTYICVPELVIPWGAPGVNSSGLHIEHCGWSRWTTAEWSRNPWMLDQSARRAAMWSWQYGIPTVVLTPKQLRANRPGFCTHETATIAFDTPGGHTDPGDGFPIGAYMHAVRDYRARIEADRKRGA